MHLVLSCGLWCWWNTLNKNERPQNLGFVYDCTQTKKSSSVPGLPHTHCKVFQILMKLIETWRKMKDHRHQYWYWLIHKWIFFLWWIHSNQLIKYTATLNIIRLWERPQSPTQKWINPKMNLFLSCGFVVMNQSKMKDQWN